MRELNAQVAKITVTELRDNTFYALITLRSEVSEFDVDSRPSDAIALAVRANAPIFAADQVIEDSGIEFPDQASPSRPRTSSPSSRSSSRTSPPRTSPPS